MPLPVSIAGLSLQTPIIAAAGTCGYVDEIADAIDPCWLGAVVTKSITRESREGNPPWRVIGLPGGMLNAIGLANVGVDVFLADKLPQLRAMRATGPRIIVNAVGHTIDEYMEAAGRLSQDECVDGIELNVSCPNVKDGLVFGTNPPLLKELVTQVRGAMRKACTLIVKLSPNTGDICATAAAAIEGGAQILSMINTYNGMVIDVNTRKPRLANGSGGMSGPAVRPLAIFLVSKVYRDIAKAARVPIIGMGGIQYWQDAVEFLLAGATGLAVGTALFVDPATPVKVMEGVQQWLVKQGCRSIEEVIGTVKI